MWIYSQTSGQLWDENGKLRDVGYSGHGDGVNNPKMQDVKNVGPIPRGLYYIGEAYKHKTLGPMAIPLLPFGHDACGRDDFFMHGAHVNDKRDSSHGCTIFKFDTRQTVDASEHRYLKVIE